MVWMIIMIPFSAVVMGGVMLTLAVSSDDGLVTDDYYRKGLQINRTLERDALAASHPQYGMYRLLDRLGVEAGDVSAWPWAPIHSGRVWPQLASA